MNIIQYYEYYSWKYINNVWMILPPRLKSLCFYISDGLLNVKYIMTNLRLQYREYQSVWIITVPKHRFGFVKFVYTRNQKLDVWADQWRRLNIMKGCSPKLKTNTIPGWIVKHLIVGFKIVYTLSTIKEHQWWSLSTSKHVKAIQNLAIFVIQTLQQVIVYTNM